MSTEPLEPLDPRLDALLESERNLEPAPETLERIWGRVAIAPPIGDGAGAPGGNAPRSGWLAAHAGSAVAVAFALGAGVGALAYAAAMGSSEERVLYVERAAPSTLIPAPSAPVAPESTSSAPSPLRLPIRAPVAAPLPTASSDSLSAERLLVAGARHSLAAGDAAAALALLDEHAHKFPRAQLAEEREALIVQALVALGRYTEARAAAARFRATSPDSLFLPAVEATLESIP